MRAGLHVRLAEWIVIVTFMVMVVVTIAQVAADLGYADHAHLTTDFRTVLGLTPNRYRSSSLS